MDRFKMDRFKSFINPLTGRSLGIEDSRPTSSETTLKETKTIEAISSNSAPKSFAPGESETEGKTFEVAIKGVTLLPPEFPPLGLDDLPSVGDTVSTVQKADEVATYSEEVIEALQELPRLLDIDINTIPQFYLDYESSGMKRDIASPVA